MEQLSVVAEEFLSDATLRRLAGREDAERGGPAASGLLAGAAKGKLALLFSCYTR